MIKKKELEHLNGKICHSKSFNIEGLMEESMLENGKMDFNMAQLLLYILMDRKGKVNGVKGKEYVGLKRKQRVENVFNLSFNQGLV